MVEKVEIAQNEQFHLFPPCFLFKNLSIATFHLSSVASLNLGRSQNGVSGNGLRFQCLCYICGILRALVSLQHHGPKPMDCEDRSLSSCKLSKFRSALLLLKKTSRYCRCHGIVVIVQKLLFCYEIKILTSKLGKVFIIKVAVFSNKGR